MLSSFRLSKKKYFDKKKTIRIRVETLHHNVVLSNGEAIGTSGFIYGTTEPIAIRSIDTGIEWLIICLFIVFIFLLPIIIKFMKYIA